MISLLPSSREMRYLRGNLHGHSTHSDGIHPPEQVASIYKSLGYDFICLSDHLWNNPRFSAQTVLDASFLNTKTFIAIPSAELHCFGKKYDQDSLWHILANGLPFDFEMASKNETVFELVSRAKSAGAFVTIAHPEWYSMTTDEALQVSHAHGVEIYNHSCRIGSGRSSGVAVVDTLLQEGHRISITATDDSHFKMPDAGGGWVMVASNSYTADDIVSALKGGQHYSSSGVEINDLYVDNGVLFLNCSPAMNITLCGAGHFAKSVNGMNISKAEFDLTQLKTPWFRITINDAGGRMAWSNPYWLEDIF
tara:strand:- start:1638 stop:2561 length:924 start_codon:yes stop_codon:yes gene_type:complete